MSPVRRPETRAREHPAGEKTDGRRVSEKAARVRVRNEAMVSAFPLRGNTRLTVGLVKFTR